MEDHGDAKSGRSIAGPPLSLEEENKKLKAEIAFLQKKLQLVGSVTRHDVLNQMTAIVGYNELLGMVIEDEKQKAFLERERYAVNKIRRQFQFAKDYQNIATDPPRWQNLANAVNRVKEALDKQVIRFTTPPGNFAVYADPLFDKVLHQVFDNSVCHAGVPTEIRLTLQDDGSSARLIIEDDGAGIPAKDKERIFERGYGKGTGWGLFLAREILLITGITIREEGEPGKGARFVITLPPGTFREGDGE
ncbi:MAG: HAMP domain-containing histidine kinase [Methanoregula sp.]|nr:HAMP domain-containing histidine kinase [Methanoregula sp.]